MIQDHTIEVPVSLSLTPYTGTWTKAEAGHLLRRTMFGATNQQILDAVSMGMNTAVSTLLTIPAVNPPLVFSPDEAVAPFGTTWVNSFSPATNKQVTESARLESLFAWVLQRINTEQFSIAEKMCLFWQNHFSCVASNDSVANYNYLSLIRTHALGNFKQLIKDMTIDPVMLIFLNGATNNVFAPNENYAREFLELYTIGKGPQIGPGDYTNYTEQDVAEGAKIFTGWVPENLHSSTAAPSSSYNSILHDQTVKTLSSHFGNATIPNGGAAEYANFVDIVFNEDACATFICSKIYRYFVNYDITPTVMSTVINDMAQTLIANNYDILPVMQELLLSEHFYDISLRGSIIRGPLEMMFAMYNATGSVPNFDLNTDYTMYINMYFIADAMGQSYGLPPSVGGWTAYYMAPSYSKLWVNSSLLKLRFDFAAWQTVYNGFSINGNNFQVDALTFVDGLSIPSDATTVINDTVDVFCPKGLSATDKIILKAILTNGLPDFEWTIQYNEYLADPANPTVADPVRSRVELVLAKLFRMPQFQCI